MHDEQRAERRWRNKWAGRMAANYALGGLLLGLVGAVCGAGAGAIIDWNSNAFYTLLGRARPAKFGPYHHTVQSIYLYCLIGLWIGMIIFGIAAARAKPGPTFAPLRALIRRVMIGQIGGTVGFFSLFLIIESARANIANKPFHAIAFFDSLWLVLGPPALMMCGAIAGALSKRATR